MLISPTRIVCLGDSITRGVRPGVEPGQIFEAALERLLEEDGIDAQAIALGIGSETTTLALGRFAQDVVSASPNLVTIMYGTNDSHIDEGESQPRVALDDYKANLGRMVGWARDAGVVTVLMTPIPLGLSGAWMRRSPYREQGPNCMIEPYVEAVRRIARDERVLLVDNYAAWIAEAANGAAIDDLTTDGCHPNPAGHELIARTIYRTLRRWEAA